MKKVSSYYGIICLSHDPPIMEFATFYDIDKLLANNNHPRCDSVIGRWSGGLVELICPPNDEQANSVHAKHSDCKRIDISWIRLLLQMINDGCPMPDTVHPRCWHPSRMEKLREIAKP